MLSGAQVGEDKRDVSVKMMVLIEWTIFACLTLLVLG